MMKEDRLGQRAAAATRRRLLLTWAVPLLIGSLAPPRRAHAATTQTEAREVSGFDEVRFAVTGELHIEQGRRERLTIEAEPDILRKISSEVSGKRLTLGFSASQVIAREPIVFRLTVRELRALELQTAGSVRLGQFEVHDLSLRLSGSGDIDAARIAGRKLDVQLDGSGTVSIHGGQVERLHIEIGGAGAVHAGHLNSRRAEVSVDGSGDVQVKAADHLAVRIGGSGNVRYSGDPQLEQSITGAGSVERNG